MLNRVAFFAGCVIALAIIAPISFEHSSELASNRFLRSKGYCPLAFACEGGSCDEECDKLLDWAPPGPEDWRIDFDGILWPPVGGGGYNSTNNYVYGYARYIDNSSITRRTLSASGATTTHIKSVPSSTTDILETTGAFPETLRLAFDDSKNWEEIVFILEAAGADNNQTTAEIVSSLSQVKVLYPVIAPGDRLKIETELQSDRKTRSFRVTLIRSHGSDILSAFTGPANAGLQIMAHQELRVANGTEPSGYFARDPKPQAVVSDQSTEAAQDPVVTQSLSVEPDAGTPVQSEPVIQEPCADGLCVEQHSLLSDLGNFLALLIQPTAAYAQGNSINVLHVNMSGLGQDDPNNALAQATGDAVEEAAGAFTDENTTVTIDSINLTFDTSAGVAAMAQEICRAIKNHSDNPKPTAIVMTGHSCGGLSMAAAIEAVKSGEGDCKCLKALLQSTPTSVILLDPPSAWPPLAFATELGSAGGLFGLWRKWPDLVKWFAWMWRWLKERVKEEQLDDGNDDNLPGGGSDDETAEQTWFRWKILIEMAVQNAISRATGVEPGENFDPEEPMPEGENPPNKPVNEDELNNPMEGEVTAEDDPAGVRIVIASEDAGNHTPVTGNE